MSNNLPPLHKDNISVADSKCMQKYIYVTADALGRFYSGLYLIYQSFKDKRDLPETAGLMQIAIQQALIDPLSQTFPEFKDFEFEINDELAIVALSTNAETILNAIDKVAKTPTSTSQSVNSLIEQTFNQYDQDGDGDEESDYHIW